MTPAARTIRCVRVDAVVAAFVLAAVTAALAVGEAASAPLSAPALAYVGNGAIYLIDREGRDQRRLVVGVTSGGTLSWSPDGTEIAFTAGPESRAGSPSDEIDIVGLDGHGRRRVAAGDDPSWSPDGRLIAFDSNLGDPSNFRQIYVVPPMGGEVRALTHMQQSSGFPAWSPDGDKIVFDSRVDSTHFGIYVVNVDGTGLTRLRNVVSAGCACPAWSPDGTTIAYQAMIGPRPDIFVMDADGKHPRRLTRHPARDENPDWSPDGTKIVFQSERVGNAELYTMNADATHLKRLTHAPWYACCARWAPAR